jgi:hypothetical protein
MNFMNYMRKMDFGSNTKINPTALNLNIKKMSVHGIIKKSLKGCRKVTTKTVSIIQHDAQTKNMQRTRL